MKRIIAIAFLAIALVCVMSASDPVFTGVVSSKQFIALTSDLSNQTLYTPDADTLLRVISCAENSSHIGGVTMTISWTDVYGTSQSVNFSASSSGTFCNTSALVFRSKANNPVTISTNSINGLGASVNVYAAVERIQYHA